MPRGVAARRGNGRAATKILTRLPRFHEPFEHLEQFKSFKRSGGSSLWRPALSPEWSYMALDEIQQKREIVESRARIREFVFGIQDGLISTVSLLAGVQSATDNNIVVIITGLTSMFAGAVSMATGSYLSSSAEKQIFDKELRDAEELAEREPYLAAEGLLNALGREGLKKEQS